MNSPTRNFKVNLTLVGQTLIQLRKRAFVVYFNGSLDYAVIKFDVPYTCKGLTDELLKDARKTFGGKVSTLQHTPELNSFKIAIKI